MNISKEIYDEKLNRIINELKSLIGLKVYYGELVASSPCDMQGDMVFEEPEDYIIEKVVNTLEKMGAGDYSWAEPEKSADEMFRDAGYALKEKNGRGYIYSNGEYDIFCDSFGAYKSRTGTISCQVMWKGEILACARLIKEMNCKKD